MRQLENGKLYVAQLIAQERQGFLPEDVEDGVLQGEREMYDVPVPSSAVFTAVTNCSELTWCSLLT